MAASAAVVALFYSGATGSHGALAAASLGCLQLSAGMYVRHHYVSEQDARKKRRIQAMLGTVSGIREWIFVINDRLSESDGGGGDRYGYLDEAVMSLRDRKRVLLEQIRTVKNDGGSSADFAEEVAGQVTDVLVQAERRDYAMFRTRAMRAVKTTGRTLGDGGPGRGPGSLAGHAAGGPGAPFAGGG